MSRVVVFDIDGTLANNNHRRHFVENTPKNWKRYNELMQYDDLHKDVASILWSLHDSGDTIILCTGREEVYRDTTLTWLEEHRLAYKITDMYMRADKDYRPDTEIKLELLKRIRIDHGAPYLWFDDRKSVVDIIRAVGIRVLQVAP